ncbi:MAG: helix-turn-helix domain-containing protein [Paracoccus sp. (in: a-proteobacteria)]|uniref:helix-turn-helix domain-containing protein n=1 Tax=Paracoccus sp. TaxID=267 RepID=UPI0039E50173
MKSSPETWAYVAPGGAGSWIMPTRRLLTSDIDEQSALLTGWNQSYDQLSAGRFTGELTEARLGSTYFFREVTSTALRQTGALGHDLCAIGVPLALEGVATFCGDACGSAKLHLFSGSDGFEFHSPSGLDILGVVLPRADLVAPLVEEDFARVEPLLARPGLLPTDPKAMAEFARLARESLELLAERDCVPRRLTTMERELRAALIRALLETEERAGPPPLTLARRARLMREARDYAARDTAEAVPSVEEICQALHVSRRTLQYCFQEAVGAKPATYLRAVRMNGARRSIKAGESVTDAATHWGFWHFGRFAREYRFLFGELPSATARRHCRPR